MIKAVYKLLQDLFRGVSPSIGMWPNSSAYYSVDVIFDASEDLSTSTILDDLRSIPTYGLPDHFGDRPEEQDTGKNYVPAPKLVEVNFMGDWRGLTSSTMTDAFEEWKEDLFTVLATDIVPNQKRLHKL